MMAGILFISNFAILAIFNYIYVLMTPSEVYTMTIGAISGLIAQVVFVGVISGIQILGSGLNSESIKILFGIATLMNILFQINIAGLPIGLGLINNVYNVFINDVTGIGLFITIIIGTTTIVSGLVIIIGGQNA